MFSISVIANIVTGLLKGPVGKVLDAYIHDAEVKRAIAAELESRLVEHLGQAMELQQGVVLAEVTSEHWLTRSWRPLLMLLLMAMLVLVGFALPAAELVSGHALLFHPQWQALPPEFWSFLQWGMGGYIGGRSLEKIAGQIIAKNPGK
jgi:hypothetical protein